MRPGERNSKAEVQPLAIEAAGYGVYFQTDQPGLCDVFGGMAVPPGANVPEGLVLREVPAAQYAVFECSLATIGATWGAIFAEWLPTSEYEEDRPRPCVEHSRPAATRLSQAATRRWRR